MSKPSVKRNPDNAPGDSRRKLVHLPSEYTPNFLTKINRNFLLGKTLNGRYQQIVSDRGGDEALTYMMKADIRSYLFLDCLIEHNEQKIAAGEEIDQAVHVQQINARALLSSRIGVDRKPRGVKGLHEHMRGTAA